MTDWSSGAPYPEDSLVELIKNFEGTVMDFFDLVEMCWIHEYGCMKRHNYGGEHRIYMATGGWSGNEDIIQAMRENKSWFWMMSWHRSERGGAFWFRFPSPKRATVQSKGGLVSLFGK